MDQNIYQAYLDILQEELIPAMGCTETIAVAYAGALARKALGRLPERVELTVSGNIIKNVKSVIMPHTGGQKGLRTAVAVSICCGKSDRALVVSNLVTIHLKTGIGTLSAYCGAPSAGAGAGAGICYLYGGRFHEIDHTIVNALAINSGMICDGAKANCAAKIASAVEAGLLGWQMNVHDSQFYGGDGIVVKGVEDTIWVVSQIARDGMRATDNEIIHFMMKNT